MMKFGTMALVCGLLCAQDYPRIPFSIGGGLTELLGGTGRRLNRGWNFGIATGINLHRSFGVMLEFDHNSLGVNRNDLNALGFSQGSVRIRSLTVNPIVHLIPKGPVDVYLIGGGGLYHLTEQFLQPAGVTSTNPRYSVNKPGVNGGLGISFGSKWHSKVFIEARYHCMLIRDRHTALLPVTIGFRW